MSVFHTCYRFCRVHYAEVAPLWPSVREEVRAWKGLMIFLLWGRRWSELVTQSDASEQGRGVRTSFWTQSQVSAVGRIAERSRFRFSGHSARESALSAAGLVRDPLFWSLGPRRPRRSPANARERSSRGRDL